MSVFANRLRATGLINDCGIWLFGNGSRVTVPLALVTWLRGLKRRLGWLEKSPVRQAAGISVHAIVLEELERRAVILIRPGFQAGIDDRAHRIAIFRRSVRGDQLELLN